MLHPLTEDQLSLLNEFKESGLTIKDFTSLKGIRYNSLAYIIWKDKRLKECNSINNNSFIPIKLDNPNNDYTNINKNINKVKNNMRNITINGFNIDISIDDLKELLK